MKFIFICFAMLLYSLPSLAQGQGDANFILEMYEGERHAIVLTYMNLDKTQLYKFNEIYAKYELKRKKLDKIQAEVIGKMIDQDGQLTEEEAGSTADKYFSYQKEYQKLQKKYFKEFKKLLGAKKALAFVQVDEYLEHVTRVELSKVLPGVQKGG